MQSFTTMCHEDNLMGLIHNDKKETYSAGFGLCFDIFLSTIIWLIPCYFIFRYQNLSAYKMKHANVLDTKNKTVTIIYEVLISLLSAYHVMSTSKLCADSTPFG